MSNKSKDVGRKNCTCYFHDDIINIENLYPNKIKIDKKSNKKFLFCYIGYLKMIDSRYIKSKSAYPLYLITNKMNGYFVEINWNKCLELVATDASK